MLSSVASCTAPAEAFVYPASAEAMIGDDIRAV